MARPARSQGPAAAAPAAEAAGEGSGAARPRCAWCGRPLPKQGGPGRPRRFCRQGCRQAAHINRKLAAAHGLAPGDVIVSREQLDELHGLLYALQASIEDARRDTAGRPTRAELQEALDWVATNAEPLRDWWLTPDASGE